MKRLIHFFIGHNWKRSRKKGWDYSEPHDPEMGSDWLPTYWRQFNCSCGMRKRVYSDKFTHLGKGRDRVFIYSEIGPRWEDLQK